MFVGFILLCMLYLQNADLDSHNFTVTQAGKGVLFKEWELIVEEEDKVVLFLLIQNIIF